MSDEAPKKRPLSEIGHLFLSSVRERHMGGSPAPQRTPPGQTPPPAVPAGDAGRAFEPAGDADLSDDSIDLTPEEYAEVFGAAAPSTPASDAPPEEHTGPARPITAVIAGHLTGEQLERTCQYARHLAARVGRVGLIELDASEFRLMCFEPGVAARASDEPVSPDRYDPRRIAEAIEELNWDVRRWLLLVPNPRTPEARMLLREVDHWALLSTCDHDGVVSAYRMLKSLAEEHRPRLTLAVLDAEDTGEVERVTEKLSGVCGQFLDWPLTAEPPVSPEPAGGLGVAEHPVLYCRPTRDKAQIAAAPQWPIVADFVIRSHGAVMEAADDDAAQIAGDAGLTDFVVDAISNEDPMPATEAPPAIETPSPRAEVTERQPPQAGPQAGPRLVADLVVPVDPPKAMTVPATPESSAPAHSAADAEVLDLPGADAPAESILAAVLHRPDGGWVECPLRAPMCPAARLAVGRDRVLTLLAVTRQGLAELKSIGQAYRWLVENRVLIGMAVPQFAFDPAQPPRLRLLVDQADASADALQPLLQSGHVTVQPYRKLRWGGKTGLLLEAA